MIYHDVYITAKRDYLYLTGAKQTLYHQVNYDLDILDDWFKANQLSANPSKTKYIIFSRRDTASEHDLDLLIDDEKLFWVVH